MARNIVYEMSDNLLYQFKKRRAIYMISANIHEIIHNFSRYLKEVKDGESITIMERNTPVADIVPHNENISRPGWKKGSRR